MNTSEKSKREVIVRRRWFASFMALSSVVAFAISRTSPMPSRANAAEPAREVAPTPTTRPTTPPRKVGPATEADRVKALGSIARVDRPLREYLRRYREFPTGSNAEVTKALTGANPDRVVFVVHAESPMNAAGELVDAWGTPFFFHQVSGKQMEIMSAGPDHAMWTADDVKVPCH